MKQGTVWDRIITLITVGGISIPVFWLGLALMLLFAFYLRWLPPSGMGNGRSALYYPAGNYARNLLAFLHCAGYAVVDARVAVAALYCRGAGQRADRNRVILKHALKNSLIPIVTLIGLDLGSYLNGAVLTETIFGWDGLGRYALEGIMKRDYPVIMGVVLFGAVIFVTMNLLVDISYHFLDPRIRIKECQQ